MITKILKFYSDTCAPCKVLTNNLKTSVFKTLIENVDIYTNFEKTKKYSVRKVPTMVFLDQYNNVVETHTGVLSSNDFDKLIQDINIERADG